jgi:hypothetical protein
VASTKEVPLILVQIGLVGRQKQNQGGIYNLSNSFISIRDYPDSPVVLFISISLTPLTYEGLCLQTLADRHLQVPVSGIILMPFLQLVHLNSLD